MNKKELQESIERLTGTMNPNISQIAKATGHSRDFIRALMRFEKCDRDGNAKRYFSGQVAEVLLRDVYS